ncbi:MAG: 2-aminoadipate transaminase [Pseudonocardiales bacterium]|jgi:2-aminoadipate transaminase|nr:2-aminoadipate transaminase [Pseudonocardiales bacterium]
MQGASGAAVGNEGAVWQRRMSRRTAGQDGFLTGILALANAQGVINFSGGFPAPELFPTETVGRIVTDLLTHDAQVALQYAPSEGIASVREAIRDLLARTDGHRPAEDELMITSGGIDAVTLIGKSMLDAGDIVAVEEPTYLGAVSGFAGFDAAMHGVAMDDEGMQVARLAELINSGVVPKLVYTIPEYQNPTGRVMSLRRRHELVDLCRTHGVLIVEDVAYRELGFYDDRLPCLLSLGPDVVMQMGTFSKTIFPGIRLGWAAAPAEVVSQLVVAKQNSDQCAGALGQRIVEAFLRGGHLPAQLERERALYRSRGEAIDAALRRHMPADATWTVPRGGFFTWLRLPGIDTVQLSAVTTAADVAFVPGAPFFANDVQHDYLRLSYSRATIEEIDTGIARLARAADSLRTP